MNKKYNFVTLFDSNYLSRGLCLYNSLKEHCESGFNLYVLAMNDIAADYLKKQDYKSMTVFTVQDIKVMYPVLERLQQERTRGEFSWTLSAFSIQYAMKQYNLSGCTYLDSDIYFFNDPALIIEKKGDNSIIITEHNYYPIYDQSYTSGKFCVQFMYFSNNERAQKALEWWRQRCEEWCYNRMEDGKFGDQKYLDDWESRFEGVYNCHEIGSCIAPWNVQKLNFKDSKGILIAEDKISKVQRPAVFYHFHNLTKLASHKWSLCSYLLEPDAKEFIYKPYLKCLEDIESTLPENCISKPGVFKASSGLRDIASFIKHELPNFIERRRAVINNIMVTI